MVMRNNGSSNGHGRAPDYASQICEAARRYLNGKPIMNDGDFMAMLSWAVMNGFPEAKDELLKLLARTDAGERGH